MNRLYNFVIKERVYILMLVFIALFNAANAPSKKAKEAERETRLASLQQKFKADIAVKQGELKAKLEKRPGLALLFSAFVASALFGFFIGLALCINAAAKMMKGKEMLARRAQFEEKAWDLLDIARVAILIFFAAYIVAIIAAAFFAALKVKVLDEHITMLLDTTIIDTVALACVITFIFRKYNAGVAALGIKLRGWLTDIAAGIAGYLAILPVIVGILILVVWLSGIAKYEPPAQPVLELFVSEKRGALLLYGTLFVALFGPVCEEVFFRGFAYAALRNKFGVKPALLLTSAAFGALHGNIVAFFPITALGALLAYLYEKTGSLVPSITVHIIHNSTLVAFIFLFKELAI